MDDFELPKSIDKQTWIGIIASVARGRRERQSLLSQAEQEAIRIDDIAEFQRKIDRSESNEIKRKFTNELGLFDPTAPDGWTK